jgi:hypothetical protein
MKRNLILLVLFSGCFMARLPVRAQSNWELKKDEDSIFIYTRETPDSKFNELKVNLEVHGTLQQLRSILLDVDHYKDWVYASKSSNLVEKKSDEDLTYYSEMSAPWPLENRDFYSRIKTRLDSLGKKLFVSSCNLAGKYKDKDHLVRVPFLKAEWVATLIGASRIRIEYILDWNPGGSIPAWIANMFVTKGPYKSFSLLQKKMALLNH